MIVLFLSPDETLSNIYPRMKNLHIIYGGRGGDGWWREREVGGGGDFNLGQKWLNSLFMY